MLRPVTACLAERAELSGRIKDEYKGPGGMCRSGHYLAHEFRAEPDRRMLYIEDHC